VKPAKSYDTFEDYMDEKYFELIESARVSPQTRDVLLKRATPDSADDKPSAVGESGLTTLRAVTARLIPQQDPVDRSAIGLAARIDRELAEGNGDGWRYASLPSDTEAYRVGLDLLNEFAQRLKGVSFDRLAPERQDSLLEAIASGQTTSPKFDLQRWFEDLCAAATRIYVSHPATLARMGYSGIADDPNGFVQLGLGKVEPWEPVAQREPGK
jgi:hypothetical protein